MIKNKKKILFILHLPPPVHGSSVIGIQIKNSHILNNAIEGHFVNIGTTIGLNEIGKKPIFKFFRFIPIFWQVFMNIITVKPELCYFAINAKGTALYRDSIIVFLMKLFKINLVYHLHNKGVSHNKENFADNLLYKFVFKNSNVILLSKFLYPDIQKYVSEDRVYFCPNGIPDNRKQIGKRNKNENDKVKILFLSNLLEAKGVYVLLDACKILMDKQLNFHCTFVGEIGDISEVQLESKVQELELTNCVDYVGKKYNNEKEEEFVLADIFVHPTLSDCFPLVLLEAMQYSLPIVSTIEGAIPEIVEDGINGYLVSQRDSNSLALKLEILIANPELRKNMGDFGRAKFEKEYTLNTFEKQLTQLLISVN